MIRCNRHGMVEGVVSIGSVDENDLQCELCIEECEAATW